MRRVDPASRRRLLVMVMTMFNSTMISRHRIGAMAFRTSRIQPSISKGLRYTDSSLAWNHHHQRSSSFATVNDLFRRIERPSSSSSTLFMMATRPYSATLTAIRTSKDTSRPYHLVIVESPSKCKTISKILEQFVQQHSLDYDYIVTSSMGHVRNLPRSRKQTTATSTYSSPIIGVDVHHDYTPQYEILPERKGLVRELQKLAKEAQQVILATDEDREGEAVAWHLTQVLDATRPYQRVTFTEITPKAITEAISNPHELNMNLVEAQETRRILDRLAGYTLSPILWKKIAPGLSAGRVQSVGMALIVQRERERLLHRPVEYYDAQAVFDKNVTATLVAVNGVSLAGGGDFDNQGKLIASKKLHLTETDAEDLLSAMAGGEKDVRDPNRSTWTVVSIQSKQRSNTAPMPFTTSTLQQDANRQLGMSVSQTMQTAQSLYESGFISYMRTDSTQLSDDAHGATEGVIRSTYDSRLVAPPRKTKSKNAQEAHEAIRPAIQPDGTFLLPDKLPPTSNSAAARLYELIYKRTVASRMTAQVVNQTSVEIEGVSPDEKTRLLFRVSGSVVVDPGFTLALGRVSSDTILPPFFEGQRLECQNLTAVDHTTKPPPRYTEASFVKELEALGVGRPSTYAGTVKLLRDRAYVGTPVRSDESNGRRTSKQQVTGAAISAQRAAGGEEFMGGGSGPLVPSLTAFVVCSLLENHCGTYVDPGFTAAMEERLDQIARGEGEEDGNMRIKYLDEFYAGDDGLAAKVKLIDENVPADEARRASLPSLFLNNSTDDIGLFVGPWGPYVQRTANDTSTTTEKPHSAPLPAGMASDLSTITPETLNALLSSRQENGVLLGYHPDDGRSIRIKIGRFGAYLQWGDDGEEATTTHSLPKHIRSMRNIDYEAALDSDNPGASLGNMLGLTLEQAVGYVGLPRTVGTLNDLPILASIGPYGPYLKYNNSFVSLNKKDGDVLTVDEETAERLVTEGIIKKRSKLGRGVLAELGEKDGSMVQVKEGRFGTYLNWKRVNAKLPNEYADNPESMPLEEAWDLLQPKAVSSGGAGTSTSKSTNVELPPAPKRPLSAYLLFCAEKRPEVSQKIKALGDISKELARLWADTSNRSKYEELAAKEKEAYEQAKRDWQVKCQAILDKSSSASTGESKKKFDFKPPASHQPKRPRSAYLYFCSEHRPKVAETVKSSLGDISKELARQWAETTDRSAYEELAAQDKLRYQQEIMNNGVDVSSRNSIIIKAPTSKSTTKSSTTTKRSPSAYMLFCREYRKTIVDPDTKQPLAFGETTQKLAELWRNCDDDVRAKFEQQAQQEKKMQASTR